MPMLAALPPIKIALSRTSSLNAMHPSNAIPSTHEIIAGMQKNYHNQMRYAHLVAENDG